MRSAAAAAAWAKAVIEAQEDVEGGLRDSMFTTPTALAQQQKQEQGKEGKSKKKNKEKGSEKGKEKGEVCGRMVGA